MFLILGHFTFIKENYSTNERGAAGEIIRIKNMEYLDYSNARKDFCFSKNKRKCHISWVAYSELHSIETVTKPIFICSVRFTTTLVCSST